MFLAPETCKDIDCKTNELCELNDYKIPECRPSKSWRREASKILNSKGALHSLFELRWSQGDLVSHAVYQLMWLGKATLLSLQLYLLFYIQLWLYILNYCQKTTVGALK